VRGSALAGALSLVLVLVAACGDDDSPAGGGTTTTVTAAPDATGSDAPAGPGPDMCELVEHGDVESIVTSASSDPDRMTVADRPPPLRGACAFTIENPGVGGSVVNLLVIDELLFDLDRENEEIEDVPGLGDEAFTFHGMGGRALHVRSSDTYFSVEVGSFDDRMGLTEDSLRELAELILGRL
jgi:hypothetical protein